MKKILSLIVSLFIYISMTATSTMTFGYCGEPAMSFGVEWQEYTAVVDYPKEFVEKFDGCVIKAVEIASPDNFENPEVNNFTSITLNFYNEIGGEAFYSQPMTLSDKSFTWTRAELTTPVSIERDKPFCVGYSGIAPTIDDACFAVDMNYNDENNGLWLGWTDEETGKQMWEPYTEWYGNLCLRLVIEGENLPRDEMSLDALYVPASVETDKPFDVTTTVTNEAANELSSFAIAFTIAGHTDTIVADLVAPIGYGMTADVKVNGLVCNESTARTTVDYKIVAVNGNAEGKATDNSGGRVYVQSMPQGIGFARNVVVEEGTGTWCGYCPMGIVALRQLAEKYDDGSFIPVAIHYDDEMEVRSYMDIAKKYFNSYPSALVNRDTYRYGVVEPDPELLETVYLFAKEIPAYANIDFKAVFTDDSKSELSITTISTFAVPTPDRHHIEIALAQNGIGPYDQTNYFADFAEGVEMGGFESLGNPVSMTFDHVGCTLKKAGSLPETVSPGENYSLTVNIPVEVMDKAKDFDIVVMLVNDETGAIENAKSQNADSLTGIGMVSTDVCAQIVAGAGYVHVSDASAGVEVFTPAGVCVASERGTGAVTFHLPAGFYIVKAGTVVDKVCVR